MKLGVVGNRRQKLGELDFVRRWRMVPPDLSYSRRGKCDCEDGEDREENEKMAKGRHPGRGDKRGQRQPRRRRACRSRSLDPTIWQSGLFVEILGFDYGQPVSSF